MTLVRSLKRSCDLWGRLFHLPFPRSTYSCHSALGENHFTQLKIHGATNDHCQPNTKAAVTVKSLETVVSLTGTKERACRWKQAARSQATTQSRGIWNTISLARMFVRSGSGLHRFVRPTQLESARIPEGGSFRVIVDTSADIRAEYLKWSACRDRCQTVCWWMAAVPPSRFSFSGFRVADRGIDP